MEDTYIWKIKCGRPIPVIGIIFCVLSSALLFILLHSRPFVTVLPPIIVLVIIFFSGIYDVLKCWLFQYPTQIKMYPDCLEVVYSKGVVKRLALKEINRITFNIRSPQRGWWRLSSPRFEFYDRKNKLVVVGDVPSYEQFQEVHCRLENFPVRILIPDYTKDSYEKFFTSRR